MACVAGYRIDTNPFLGKNLYVGDLVTSAAVRSRGHGERMIGRLREQGLAAGCRARQLASGTHRGQAHRFYFKQGFTIPSYHFNQRRTDGG